MRSFSETVAQAQRGDREAQAALYARYGPVIAARLRASGARRLRRRFDTEDLVHSVFAEVLRDLPRFEDRGEEAFRHWVYLKTESKVRGKFRRARGAAGGRREATLATADELSAQSAGAGPATAAGEIEARDVLRAVLLRLPPGYRNVLLLRTEQGLRFDEIARRLGMSNGAAARMRYVRALVALHGGWTSRSSRT